MATAQTIIDRAMRLIGAVEAGESATAAETADCLTALNAMIESWQTERLYAYGFVDSTFTLVPGDGSVTLGPASNITARPVAIDKVFLRANDIDYQIELIDRQRWFDIPDKTVSSDIPFYAYYDPAYTVATLNLYPVPNTAYQLHVVVWAPISTLAAAATAVSLPPGYERALAYNLAIEVAPEFGTEASQAVQQIAMEAKANIKRANITPMKASGELVALFAGGQYDIVSGGVV